jgi:hypothetical protein
MIEIVSDPDSFFLSALYDPSKFAPANGAPPWHCLSTGKLEAEAWPRSNRGREQGVSASHRPTGETVSDPDFLTVLARSIPMVAMHACVVVLSMDGAP